MPTQDPLRSGIVEAIRSARESYQMDEQQRKRARRRAMLDFAQNLGNKTRSRDSNFLRDAGQALAPALQAYDQYEDEAIKTNQEIDRYQQNLDLQHQALDLRRQALEDQQLRNMENMQLKKMSVMTPNTMTPNTTNTSSVAMGTSGIPLESATERREYSKLLLATNKVLNHIDEAFHVLDEFRKEYSDSYSQMPIIGSKVAKLKGIVAGIDSKQRHYEAEAIARVRLDQAIGILATKFEKDLKGGILTNNILERFESMNLIPKASDSLAQMSAKLQGLRDHVVQERTIAIQSLQRNVHYGGSLEEDERGAEDAETE